MKNLVLVALLAAALGACSPSKAPAVDPARQSEGGTNSTG